MAGVVMVLAASLAILALAVFAVSAVAFLVQTSRHRSSRRWAAAAGASLVLVLVFGGIANAVRGEGGPSLSGGQAITPNAVGQTTTQRRRLQGWLTATP